MLRRLAFTLLVILSLSGDVRADWVLLIDGVKIRGRVILQTRREVTLGTEKGVLTFDMKRVKEVHLTEAPPKTEEERQLEIQEEARQKAAIEAVRESRIRRLRNQTAERTLGRCILALPLTFGLKRGRSTFDGYNGTLLGVYEEESSGAVVTASETRKVPLGARSVEELEAAIKANFNSRKGVVVHGFRKGKMGSQSALFGDLTTVKNGKKTRNLQAWFFDEGAILYTVGISVSEPQYRLNQDRYEKILRSFRFGPIKPKSSEQ